MKIAASIVIIDKDIVEEMVDKPEGRFVEPFVANVFGIKYLLKVCEGKQLHLLLGQSEDSFGKG